MNLLLASNNVNKRKEFEAIMPSSIHLYSLTECGIYEELPENEDSIEGNSLSKAKFAAAMAKMPCIAEDTGLEVVALNNEPGVYSARYAGPKATSEDNVALLLKNLHTINTREARFKTVITFYDNNEYWQFEGITAGRISSVPRGGNGFGYDNVFIPLGFDRTFAEMTFAEKNSLSHRKKAIVKFMSYYQKRL